MVSPIIGSTFTPGVGMVYYGDNSSGTIQGQIRECNVESQSEPRGAFTIASRGSAKIYSSGSLTQDYARNNVNSPGSAAPAVDNGIGALVDELI